MLKPNPLEQIGQFVGADGKHIRAEDFMKSSPLELRAFGTAFMKTATTQEAQYVHAVLVRLMDKLLVPQKSQKKGTDQNGNLIR